MAGYDMACEFASRVLGVFVVHAVLDPLEDEVTFETDDGVRFSVDTRIAQLHGGADRLRDAVREAYADATIGRRYDQRPRPRLGAGTVGYARRRRP